MAVTVEGELAPGVTAKDLILAVIGQIGTGGGQGYVIEYRGAAIRALSMEARMTVCNMTIEAGARAGLIAPDETTFAYLEGRPHAPKGDDWNAAVDYWRTLVTDDDAAFDHEVTIDASSLTPYVTWGTNPAQGAPLSDSRAGPGDVRRRGRSRSRPRRRSTYMGLTAGTPLRDIAVDTVFLGSCTNGRIEDLRAAAEVVRGRQVADGVRMLVVPGSVRVRLQAEQEGLDVVFKEAGAEWRHAGCSMCLGMNPDQLTAGRAQRLDVEPQLRGTPGRGWSHASRLAAGGRRDRRRRSSRLTRRPDAKRADMDAFTTHTGTAVAAPAVERRHRPDHPGRLPEAGDAHRI